MRQHCLQFCPEGIFSNIFIRCVIGAEKDLLPLIPEIPYGRIPDTGNFPHTGFDFTGFHPVAVDFHHRVQPAGYHNIAVRQAHPHIAGMKDAAAEYFSRLLRQVDIAPEERIVKTDFTLFPVGNLRTVFIQKTDLDVFKYRLPDRRKIIALIYDKLRHMEAGFAHTIIVNQGDTVKINTVCSFTAGYQSLQTGGRPVCHDTKDRRGQKSKSDPIPVKLLIHPHRISGCIHGKDYQMHAGIQGIHPDFHSSDKVKRGKHGHTGLLTDQISRMSFQGSLVEPDFPVFLQNPFRFSRAPRSIDGKAGGMLFSLPEAGKRFLPNNFRPGRFVDRQTAAAVLLYCLNPFRCIGILNNSKRGTGLPYAKHDDKGSCISGKPDQHKIFSSNAFLKQPGIDAG